MSEEHLERYIDQLEKQSDKILAERNILEAERDRLKELLRKSKGLASIGYRIGEADMRGHDKIGERYGKQQDDLIAEIDAALKDQNQ